MKISADDWQSPIDKASYKDVQNERRKGQSNNIPQLEELSKMERIDKRRNTDLRPVSFQCGFQSHPAGSVLVTFGDDDLATLLGLAKKGLKKIFALQKAAVKSYKI